MKKKTFSPPSQNPFVKNKELIKQQGVVVFDYVTSLASYTERVISPNIVIAIFHSGVIRLEYDMQSIVFRSKGICVLYPNHIVSVKDVSPDLQATLIVISNQFYDEMLRHSLRRYKNEYLKAPFFKLNNHEYETTLHIVEVVKAACQIKGASRTNIIVDILDILARMTDYHRFHDKAPKEDISSNELLFYHFYEAIAAHHKESHEIQFYAERFSLSPKYFANVIKQTTGIAASDWIARFIVTKAKHLLKRDDINMLAISKELGFGEQSSFSRYFKHVTGITPSQFRKDNK